MNDRVAQAAQLLNRGDRFAAELRAALGEGPEADAALKSVAPFLDDRRVAEALIRKHGGKGRPWLEAELARRGCDPVAAEAALADLPDELERARAVLQGERKPRTEAQAARFLLSRGFDEETVGSVVEG